MSDELGGEVEESASGSSGSSRRTEPIIGTDLWIRPTGNCEGQISGVDAWMQGERWISRALLTWRPALEDRVVRTFVSAEVFAFPPLPPVVFEDMILGNNFQGRVYSKNG
jgi:hypothetical protein